MQNDSQERPSQQQIDDALETLEAARPLMNADESAALDRLRQAIYNHA